MKLIIETVDFEAVEILKEDASGEKNYYIQGIILQANKKNRNNRWYPKEILQKEAARYTSTNIAQNRAYGELGHPDTPTINLDRVSHMFKELKEDGNNFVGKAKIVDTPYGKIAKSFIDEGAKLGISSRGLGTLSKKDGMDFVGHDFFLATAGDLVADPSAPDAFVRGIMEDKEWVYIEGKGWVEQFVEHAKEVIKTTPGPELNAKKLQIFEAFMRRLSNFK